MMIKMNKVFIVVVTVGFLIGCGQKNEIKGTGEKSGETKSIKSDSGQTKSGDTSKIILSDLPEFKMTFEREGGVYIVNSDLTNEKFLFSGHDNLISTDGSDVLSTKSNADGTRNIAVYNIAGKTTKILNSITGKQSFDASYSPDGESLVFCNFSGKKWNIAIVNSDDTGFKILSDGYKSDLFSPTFAPDGNSILCHDLQNFIEIDLKGNIVKTIPFKEVFGDVKIYFSSANKAYYINNKSEILFDADTDVFFETAREPISNVFVYNIQNKALKNLSDKNISTYDPFPLSGGMHILFSAYTKADLSKSPDPQDREPVITSWIYIMKTDGTGKTKMIQNAFEPSASKIQ